MIITSGLSGYLSQFPDNPAASAWRQGWEIEIPLLTSQLTAQNSLLRFSDLELFNKTRNQDNKTLSESEKKMLTASDLHVRGGGEAVILSGGFRNYQLKISTNAFFTGKILDKQYTRLALYGNQTNHDYNFTAGEGSRGHAYVKLSLSAAMPDEFFLEKLLGISTDSAFWKNQLNASLALGINVNFYYPLKYGKLDRSRQHFGSFTDSLYYDYEAAYHYTDEESSGNLGMGFGLGLLFKYPLGEFSLHLDDILARMNLKNLAGGAYDGTFVDYLLYFHSDDYDPFDESSENDSLRLAHKTVKFSPTLRMELIHEFYRNLYLKTSYSSSDHEYTRGFTAGIGCTINRKIPLEISFGFKPQISYQIMSGYQSRKIDILVFTTFYHGFFNHAKGLSLGSRIVWKFGTQ